MIPWQATEGRPRSQRGVGRLRWGVVAPHLAFGVWMAAVGCSGSVNEAPNAPPGTATYGTTGAAQVQAGAICEPGKVDACPCVGGGSGVQRCDDLGQSYGTCMGCPPPPGAGAPSLEDEMVALTPPASARQTETEGTAGTPEAMPVDAAEGLGAVADESMGEVLQTEALGVAPAGAAPGVSCGVGLPLLCAPDAEKCCIRSLRTDTCVDVGEACECDLPGCATTTAYCDGPEDCPGQKCCGTLRGQGRLGTYEDFRCTDECVDSPALAQREACHQDEDTCPSSLVCANSQILTNVQICVSPESIQQ